MKVEKSCISYATKEQNILLTNNFLCALSAILNLIVLCLLFIVIAQKVGGYQMD